MMTLLGNDVLFRKIRGRRFGAIERNNPTATSKLKLLKHETIKF
jgi:hypothetical protein